METLVNTPNPIMNDDDFDALSGKVHQHFEAMRNLHGESLFRTDAGNLFELYLDKMTPEAAHHNRCSTCRAFMKKYGSLVRVTDGGLLVSAIWPEEDVPAQYADSMRAMRRILAKGEITGVFLTQHKALGIQEAGDWTHFQVINPNPFAHATKSAGQISAKKKEDFNSLSRALKDFSIEHVRKALGLLEGGSIYRPERMIGPVKFLYSLHLVLENVKDLRIRTNLIWKAVAQAPVGFATIRGGVAGTFLEDIVAGRNIEVIKRKIAAKLDPTKDMRPQAAPTQGNIDQAEKIVAQLGIASSLERRFARLDEIQTIWKPEALKSAGTTGGGVFGHLKQQASDTVVSDRFVGNPVVITWEKFCRTILNKALSIEVSLMFRMNLGGFVTATHADAPPILQWDSLEQRNPFSIYLYDKGSSPTRWNLPMMGWAKVTGVALSPSMWYNPEKYSHQGHVAMFVLEGAVDTSNPELALFPSTLRSELHEIRSTIEFFSKSRKLTGEEEASACGFLIGAANSLNVIRVKTDTGTNHYTIDRWD